jgi:hypothetical protein
VSGHARLGLASIVAATLACVLAATPAQAAFGDYGIASTSASLSTSQAGGRPDFNTVLNIKTDPSSPLDAFGHERPYAGTKEVEVSLPPGLVGNPNSVAKCTSLQFATAFVGGGCPQDSQVGVTIVRLYLFPTQLTEPIYSLESPGGDTVARLGFYAASIPVFINVHVRSASDYGLTATLEGIPANELLISAETTLWGIPADSSHDTQRLTVPEAYPEAKSESPPRPSGLAPAPFLSNPVSCDGPEAVGFSARSYPMPDLASTSSAALPAIAECDRIGFDPLLEVSPDSRQAAGPTGLEANLTIPQDETPTGLATSELKDATVTLPDGMTINSSAADGLAACNAAQVGYRTEGASACPDAAKIGSATFVSPALSEPLQGAIYQRDPEPGDLFRIWLVADDLGVHLKIPGDVRPDPLTGQLTTVFTDAPQLPVEKISLRFKGGARAPLQNPQGCGAFRTHYVLTPWSGNPATVADAPMTIDQGCATGGFNPGFSAGATSPVAGSHSPLAVDLTRDDGEQNVAGLNVRLPEGELATLAGVPLCPDSLAASGECPAASRIGSVHVAAGAGSQPLWLPQPGKAPTSAYLAGPYKGAPYSLVVVVPAQAGPFDLGTVVTRAKIEVDPETAQASVASDPLPQILQGVPVLYRHIHVDADRPGFMLNPTDCEPMSVGATVASAAGAIARPSSRFQVAGCGELGFKPKLGLRLFGGTRRGEHPRLRAILSARAGDADIVRAAVSLPHSEFLDQSNIRTVCTRVQFTQGQCPEGAIYGFAVAKTPLLDRPLRGPVYLRSSDNPLPDLVADLHGQVHIVLDGRIDSVHGGIRTVFESLPDAPVSKFTLTMKGGGKGLLVNSRNLCQARAHAVVLLRGHNGREEPIRPRLKNQCAG